MNKYRFSFIFHDTILSLQSRQLLLQQSLLIDRAGIGIAGYSAVHLPYCCLVSQTNPFFSSFSSYAAMGKRKKSK